MIFATFPLTETQGAILAHGLRLPHRRIPKGSVLQKGDIKELEDAGFQHITIIRLENGDVGEDDAADILAKICLQPGIRASRAHTGRVNLFAEHAGLFVVHECALNALNNVDEAITCATLYTPAKVDAGQMIATIKIIPFAVRHASLTQAQKQIEDLSHKRPIFKLASFKPHNIGLILTDLVGMDDKIHQKARKTVRNRIEALGSSLKKVSIVAHEETALARAITQQHKAGLSPILILGASATVDRRDTLPAAMVQAGGTVTRFGMAVDPGNLLTLGKIGNVDLIGLPGCARSPKLNGFDWVLERILADVPIAPTDWAKMAHGGLLQEIETRPQPRLGKPEIAAVILAAGQSERMQGQNKLLAEIDGKPLIRHVIDNVCASQLTDIIVVTGHDHDAVRAALHDQPVRFAFAPGHAQGMGHSLAFGVSLLTEECQAVIICLGDMPDVTSAQIDILVAAWHPGTIAIASYQGQRGNPVILPRSLFPQLLKLTGDEGARRLISDWPGQIHLVEMADASVLHDVDTPAALAQRLQRGFKS